MKKFTKIWLRICLVLFLLSLGCFAGSIAMGTTMKEVGNVIGNNYYTISNEFRSFSGLKFRNSEWKEEWNQATKLKNTKTELKTSKNLKIKLYGQMIIQQDKNCKQPNIEIDERMKNRVRIIDEETLTIVTKPVRDTGGKIILNLPENYQFKGVDIELDSGNIQMDTLIMNIIQIEAEEGNIDISDAVKCYTANLMIDSGSIHAEKMECIKQLKAKVDVGNIEIKNMSSSDIDLRCDVGKITAGLEEGFDLYNIALQCNTGNIKLGAETYSNMKKNITSSSGSDDARKLYVSCDVGSVEINE